MAVVSGDGNGGGSIGRCVRSLWWRRGRVEVDDGEYFEERARDSVKVDRYSGLMDWF